MLMIKVSERQEEEGAEDAKEGGDESVAKEAEEEPVHWCYMCDGCKMSPIVGARYKCLEWVLFACNRCTFF